VLEQLELPRGCLQRRPCELSGGELQRVALARALVLKPEFLVLDEPFSALDDLTAMKIVRLLKGVFRRLGLGILFIGHHPRHVGELADRVAVLEKGRLISPGV
jgi:peptide/nickel transport system ATP-binding protein